MRGGSLLFKIKMTIVFFSYYYHQGMENLTFINVLLKLCVITVNLGPC